MKKVKFTGKISSMGNKFIIIIPKEFHNKIENHTKKQLRVVVDEF